MDNQVIPTATVAEPIRMSHAIAAVPAQARSDEHLIALWLHGRSPGTQRAYQADLAAFRAQVRLPLREVTLGDVQGYQDTLDHLASASQARKLSAVKSLLSFGHKTGYLAVNVGAPIRLPRIKGTLAERILDIDAVLHLLALERQPRNKALLRLLYLGGLRISEACGLRVRDLAPRMLEAMYRAPGIGLAAPQVGVGLRLVVVDLQRDEARVPMVLVNPEVVGASSEEAVREEG